VCDNVISTVRFLLTLFKLVKFSFFPILFATGFITPVNKDYHNDDDDDDNHRRRSTHASVSASVDMIEKSNRCETASLH